jgi:type IV pilus assembly protein PilW
LIYYVAPSATPSTQGGQAGPALWRIVGNQSPEEVISGVERMEVQYGVDTNRDTVVDQYSNADAVNAANNWSNVMSIKIAVLVRSAEPNAPEVDKKTYTLLDTSVGPFNDRYERSVFMTTAALRNRAT